MTKTQTMKRAKKDKIALRKVTAEPVAPVRNRKAVNPKPSVEGVRLLGTSTVLLDETWEKSHTTENNEIFQIVKGHITATVHTDGDEDRTYQLSEGGIFILPAGTSVSAKTEDAHVELFVVTFAGKLSHFLCNGLSTAPEALRSEADLMLTRMRLYKGNSSEDHPLQRARFSLLLEVIIAGTDPDAETRPDLATRRVNHREAIIREAKGYIERHYRENLYLADLAKHLNMSPCHLSRVLSNSNNFAFAHYVSELRVQEARELLKDPSLSNTDIAARVGFSGANYFAKVFKRYTGLSPYQWRVELGIEK